MAYIAKLYIDGNRYDDNNYPMDLAGKTSSYEILSNGISHDDFLWTYKGSGTFLGFALTQNASTPELIFTVGYQGTNDDIANLTDWAEEVYLYSVVSSSSTIMDLTGTTWYFNEQNITPSLNNFNINFTANDKSYSSIKFYEEGTTCQANTVSLDGEHVVSASFNLSIDYLAYTANYMINLFNNIDFLVYNNSSQWQAEAYRTIEITGGTDATNSDLITWLQENATLLSSPSPYSAADPLVIRYKGEIIYSTSSTSPITLAVSGKYLEDDITVTLNPPFAEQDSNTLNISGAYTTTKSGTVLTLT